MALITQKRVSGTTFAIASGMIRNITSDKTIFGRTYTKIGLAYSSESIQKEDGNSGYKSLIINVDAFGNLGEYAKNLDIGDRIVVLGELKSGKYFNQRTQQESTWWSISCDSIIVQEARYSYKTEKKKRKYDVGEEAEEDDVLLPDDFDAEHPGKTRRKGRMRKGIQDVAEMHEEASMIDTKQERKGSSQDDYEF